MACVGSGEESSPVRAGDPRNTTRLPSSQRAGNGRNSEDEQHDEYTAEEQRLAGIRFDQPEEVEDGEDGGRIDQLMDLIPPLPAQPADRPLRRGHGERDEQHESGEPDSDERPLDDVLEDELEGEQLVQPEAVVAVGIEVRVGENIGMLNFGVPAIVIKMLRQKFDQRWSAAGQRWSSSQVFQLRITIPKSSIISPQPSDCTINPISQPPGSGGAYLTAAQLASVTQ